MEKEALKRIRHIADLIDDPEDEEGDILTEYVRQNPGHLETYTDYLVAHITMAQTAIARAEHEDDQEKQGKKADDDSEPHAGSDERP